jgi:hypothetical protein
MALFAATGCNKPIDFETAKATIEINISHEISGAQLSLGTPTVTPFGETVTITNFQYYLSHFQLVNTGGNTVPLPVSYHLVSENSNGSKTITLRVPGGNYRGVRMLVGVDSTRNVSGVQEGALDPANGMFWSWNTGYIFAKLEGRSPVSTAPLQGVTYHIGGFKAAESALQTVELAFPSTTTFFSSDTAKIALKANLDKWFSGPHSLRIANEPFCMAPGELAQRISVNYSQMFSVTSVSN